MMYILLLVVTTTKEVPFIATDLAKRKKEFGRNPRESEAEYIWRVSLSGGDQILLRMYSSVSAPSTKQDLKGLRQMEWQTFLHPYQGKTTSRLGKLRIEPPLWSHPRSLARPPGRRK